jgi:hypothetical protein
VSRLEESLEIGIDGLFSDDTALARAAIGA